MQIIVDNSAGELLPGGYASIHLQVPAVANVFSVPSSALIFNARGLSVATMDSTHHVLVKRVTIARDLGQIVELASGVTPQDRVIANPPDGVSTGDPVRLVGAAGGTAPKSN
jgi:multidrug efflux pump subunit AcrA (membrane-fusion protein)